MARKLPEISVLLEHLKQGWDNQQIADHYGVTREAVRQQLQKHGIKSPRERADHGRYIPWRVRLDHAGDYLVKRLRSYSRRQQGWPLSEAESRLLDEWIEVMEGANRWGVPLSVWYSREDGFWVDPRRPGDRDFIHVPGETEGSVSRMAGARPA